VIAVTTFSPKGYEAYGKDLLRSLSDNFPGETVAYVDEFVDDLPNVTQKLLRKVHGHDAFIANCSKSPIFSGRVEGGYFYTWDAIRFCHKVFAQIDTLQSHAGKVFWFDSDCILKKTISEEFLSSLFDGKTLSILGRPGFYTETGWVGFDTKGEKFSEFLNWYIDHYRKGLIFTLEGWHDCYALDNSIALSGVPVNDLVENWNMGDKLDVLEDTKLGEYLIHLKGNKKWSKNTSIQ
jgi:hypothetical protein